MPKKKIRRKKSLVGSTPGLKIAKRILHAQANLISVSLLLFNQFSLSVADPIKRFFFANEEFFSFFMVNLHVYYI